MKLRRLVLLLSSCLIFAPCSYAQTGAVNSGAAAPSFQGTDSSGNAVSLDDLKGKTVVLEWINPDCPYVKRHYQEQTMKKLDEKYGDQIVWLSVNSTHYMDSAANNEWKSEKAVPWSIVVDQSGDIGKAYGAKTTPHMFVIGKDGSIVYQGAIDDDASGDKDPAERVNYVDVALDKYLKGESVAVTATKSYGCSVKYAG